MATQMFRPSVLALFSSQPSSRGHGVEVRIVEFFARRLGQSVGEIFAVRRPGEGASSENRLRLKKILMRGRSTGEFRTARNGNASPNGLRNPADVRSVRQIARKTGPERANEHKPIEPREPIKKTARQHSPTHGLEGNFGVGKKRLCLQARIGEAPKAPVQTPHFFSPSPLGRAPLQRSPPPSCRPSCDRNRASRETSRSPCPSDISGHARS